MLQRRFGVFVLLLLSPLAMAQATPIVTYSRVSLGNGDWGFNVFVSDNDNANLSFFTKMTFTGPILQQEPLGSIQVDDNALANTYNGIPLANYSKALDSYFFQPWTQNTNAIPGPPTVPGILDQPGLYQINGGTGGESQYNSLQLAYIAASGSVDFSGIISRNGQNFDISGTLAVPEPASVMLLTLGAGAVVIAARRRSRRAWRS